VWIGAFHAASVASALSMDTETVDSLLDAVARRGQLLQATGEVTAQDGRLVEQYSFLHAAIQNVICAGVAPARRRRLHLAAAEQLEREHAGRLSAVASLLAAHYQAGGDPARAIRNLREAARLAMRRDAPRDAIAMLESALELAESNPVRTGRDSEHVAILIALSHAREVAYGFVAPEVTATWTRASRLAAAGDDVREQSLAEASRIVGLLTSARYPEAEEAIRSVLPLLDRISDPGVTRVVLSVAALARCRTGSVAEALSIVEAALAIEGDTDPVPGLEMTGQLLAQHCMSLALTGRFGAARRAAQESVARSRPHSQYSECMIGTQSAFALALVGDYELATPIATRCFELADANDFSIWATLSSFVIGMSELAGGRVDDGAARARTAMDARRSRCQLADYSACCCLLTEALIGAERPAAEKLLDDAAAFVKETGETYCESEIWRLRAKALNVGGGDVQAASRMLEHSFDLARARGNHWHAMLAATDLAELLEWSDGNRLATALAAMLDDEHHASVRRARETLARCHA